MLLPEIELRLLGRPACDAVTMQAGAGVKRDISARLCSLHWFLCRIGHLRTSMPVLRFEQFLLFGTDAFISAYSEIVFHLFIVSLVSFA